MKRERLRFAWRVTAGALLVLAATAPPSRAAYPPLLILDEASATGPVVGVPDGPIHFVTIQLDDSLGTDPAARDTVPSQSELTFRWHVAVDPGVTVTGYLLDDAVSLDPSVTSLVLHGAELRWGWPGFTLRAYFSNGFTSEVRRVFALGFPPTTWFAGPDPAAAPGGSVPLGDIGTLGGLFGCDSLILRPGVRPARGTFTEIYGDRAYVRSEGDTVHMNSWVVLHAGGFDADSPYGVPLGAGVPSLDDTVACVPAGVPTVVDSAGLVGSAVGFRFFYGIRLDPAGPFGVPAASPVLPDFDPATVFYAPTIAGYQAFARSGRVYLVAASRDADGLRDDRITSAGVARNIVDHVEAGTATPEELALRPLVLTFYVDRAPYLLVGDPAFVPQEGQTFPTRTLALNLLAHDDDPYEPNVPPPPPGGPTPTGILRWNVTLRGLDADGNDVEAAALPGPVFDPAIAVDVPDAIVGPDLTVDVELCDCAYCESVPGSGRCVTRSFHVTIPPSAPTPVLASLIEARALADRVRLRWSLGRAEAATVERRTEVSGWGALATVPAGGTREVAYEDDAVEPGARYGYRLRLDTAAGAAYAGETWVDVPAGPRLALEGARPNPITGSAFTVRFTLASASPARIDLLDLSGRRVAAREVGGLGAGAHVVDLRAGARVPPGVYLLRLSQDGEARVKRVSVLD